MVFPMVIMAIVGVIYILIYMYSSVALQSYVHMSLRAEAGIRAENSYAATEPKSFAPADTYGGSSFREDLVIDETGVFFEKHVYADFTSVYGGKGILKSYVRRHLEAKVYILKETEYIRSADLILN